MISARSITIFYVLSVLIYFLLYLELQNPNFLPAPFEISRQSSLKTETNFSDPFMVFCNKIDSGSASVKTASKAKCGYVFRSIGKGRLGNQMFQYASFYGMVNSRSIDENGTKIAFVYGMKALTEAFDNLSLYRSDINTTNVEGRIDKTINERGCCRYIPIGHLPCDGKNYYISGNRQNFKYFAHIKEEIRREFSNFKAPIKKKCDRLLENIFLNNSLHRQNCMTVAVHLRRGDFVRMALYTPASVHYLKRAVKYFEHIFANKVQVTPRLKHLVFVIFGDDPSWNTQAIKHLHISNPNITHLIIIDGTHPATDLCAMSKCDHIAISTGTFGVWAAFLNSGIVTYQKEYAGARRRAMTDDDFFLPHWIPL